MTLFFNPIGESWIYKLYKQKTMKTAIQLMLEDLELRYKVLSDAQMLQACAAIEGTIEYAKSLIIKEKDQIMNAFECGMSEGLSMENNTLGYDANSEKYYNQTYNQNK